MDYMNFLKFIKAIGKVGEICYPHLSKTKPLNCMITSFWELRNFTFHMNVTTL